MKSFVAEAEGIVPAKIEHVFDRMADYASWPRWMPRSFAAVDPSGRLRLDSRLRVKIMRGPPSTLTVSRFEKPREIAWTGGVRGVLFAEHRFLFEADGERTRVRSIETWRGVLAGLLRPVIQRGASRVAKRQIDGLARSFAT